MTKIYFCGSIRGGRDDAEIYARIIKYLQAYGQVLTEHVGATEQHFQEESKKSSKYIHDRDMEWMEESDGKADFYSTAFYGCASVVFTHNVCMGVLDMGDGKNMSWLYLRNFLVAEVTQPSLGVGYELGRAVAMKKPVLCLFRPNTGKLLSGMIGGADNGKTFIVKEYTGSEYEEIIKNYFQTLQN